MADVRVVRVAVTTALLSIAGALSLGAGPEEAARPLRQGDEPRVIEITASRFAFEPSTIEVTAGERVRLVIRSADGVHGLEIKKFKAKKEIPRGGTPVTVDFTANAVGRFPILCSEFCGDGHEEMTGTLVVRASQEPATAP